MAKLKLTTFGVEWTKTDGEKIPCIFFRDYLVPKDAFKNDTTLKEVDIHAKAQKICDGAFEGCKSLTKVALPETIDIIRRFAFYGCTALEAIVIPDSVKRMECWDYRRVSCVTLFPPFSQKELIEHLVEGRGEVEFYQSEEGS
ncbi:MAG: leucine-rich repeat protein [Prevotella sp.]|nr:leucine-rich repeat protein [Prevotella sp.]